MIISCLPRHKQMFLNEPQEEPAGDYFFLERMESIIPY